jgi:glycosyltransferase involved in cell wall biosynthesis
MKIAILGTRGIPNRYGGFEAFAENLSRKLAERGHQVTVYCRRVFTRPGDEKLLDPRIRRIILPGIPAKHLDTAVHTFLSALHVIFTRADVVLICNVGNSPVAWIPRLFGKPVVLNVDGLDRLRRKWGFFARSYIHFCEMLSIITPSRLVTDARAVQDYYRSRYGKSSVMIGYGAEVPTQQVSDGVLGKFNLQSKQYILYVSRLEPENNPELVINAYKQVETDWPLVMVGDSTYDRAYEQKLRTMADPRVIFTGAVYGPGYWELQQNAGIFVFACEVGGIHPALIESMAAGNAVLYLDTESNRETAGECGLAFSLDTNDLASKMRQMIGSGSLRSSLADQARTRARQCFSWDKVSDEYHKLMRELHPSGRDSATP